MAADIDALRQVRFLAPLGDRDVRRLAKSMTVRTVAAGEPILTEGESAQLVADSPGACTPHPALERGEQWLSART